MDIAQVNLNIDLRGELRMDDIDSARSKTKRSEMNLFSTKTTATFSDDISTGSESDTSSDLRSGYSGYIPGSTLTYPRLDWNESSGAEISFHEVPEFCDHDSGLTSPGEEWKNRLLSSSNPSEELDSMMAQISQSVERAVILLTDRASGIRNRYANWPEVFQSVGWDSEASAQSEILLNPRWCMLHDLVCGISWAHHKVLKVYWRLRESSVLQEKYPCLFRVKNAMVSQAVEGDNIEIVSARGGRGGRESDFPDAEVTDFQRSVIVKKPIAPHSLDDLEFMFEQFGGPTEDEVHGLVALLSRNVTKLQLSARLFCGILSFIVGKHPDYTTLRIPPSTKIQECDQTEVITEELPFFEEFVTIADLPQLLESCMALAQDLIHVINPSVNPSNTVERPNLSQLHVVLPELDDATRTKKNTMMKAPKQNQRRRGQNKVVALPTLLQGLIKRNVNQGPTHTDLKPDINLSDISAELQEVAH